MATTKRERSASPKHRPSRKLAAILVKQENLLQRPRVEPADFARWSQELDVTLFQGAMLLVGLEPFAEIFKDGYTVPFLVDCIPEDKREQFSLIYGRSKQYFDRKLLAGRSRELIPKYPRIYVDLSEYLRWANAQRFDVPQLLRRPKTGPTDPRRTRSDLLATDLRTAIDRIERSGRVADMASVMGQLKSYAGLPGSCVIEAGADYILWHDAKQGKHKLTRDLLRKRLARHAE